MGPRALVTVDGDDGCVADEIPATALGCPLSWKPYLMPGASETERNLFTVRWVSPPGSEFLQVLKAARNLTLRVAALARAGRARGSEIHTASGPGPRLVPASRIATAISAIVDSLAVALPLPRDSTAHAADSVRTTGRVDDWLRATPPGDSLSVRDL